MNLDLLTVLEKIVSGFVAFLYSLTGSIYTTLRFPLRGPVRLYRRYQAPKARQIGGLTFLCLGFFLTFYVVLRAADYTPEALLDELRTAVRTLPAFTADNLWPILAASLAATAIVDASLRLWVGRQQPHRSRRREITVAAAEYSLFWACFPAGLSAWFLVILAGSGAAILENFQGWVFALPPLVVLATVPAGTLLAMTTVQRRSSVGAASESHAPARIGRGPLRRAALTGAVACLVIFASVGGMMLGLLIQFDEAAVSDPTP